MKKFEFEAYRGSEILTILFNTETAKSFMQHLELAIKEDITKDKDGNFPVVTPVLPVPSKNVFESPSDISQYAREILNEIMESSEYSPRIIEAILDEMKVNYQTINAHRTMKMDDFFHGKLRRELKRNSWGDEKCH